MNSIFHLATKKKKKTNNTMMKRERYLIVFQKKKNFSYKKNMFSIVVEINVSRIENNKQKNFITCLTNQKNWKKKTTEQQNRPRCTNDSSIHKFVCSCIANSHFSWQSNKQTSEKKIEWLINQYNSHSCMYVCVCSFTWMIQKNCIFFLICLWMGKWKKNSLLTLCLFVC